MREEREVKKNTGRVGEKGKSWENERLLFWRGVRGKERAHFKNIPRLGPLVFPVRITRD